MPRTSTSGDWIRSKRVCMLLPPGPEQSWLMMILRRACGEAGETQTKSNNAKASKRWILGAKIACLLSPLPPPPFFGSIDSSRVKMDISGSADSKRVMGNSGQNEEYTRVKRRTKARERMGCEYIMQHNRVVHLCQAEIVIGRRLEECVAGWFCGAAATVHRQECLCYWGKWRFLFAVQSWPAQRLAEPATVNELVGPGAVRRLALGRIGPGAGCLR